MCRIYGLSGPPRDTDEDIATSPSILGGVTFAPVVPMSPAQYRTLRDSMPPVTCYIVDGSPVRASYPGEMIFVDGRPSPHRFGSVQ